MPASFSDLLRGAREVVAAAGPAAGKLAQVADLVDPAWIPEDHYDEAVALLDALRRGTTEPIPFRDVERGLHDAWGGKVSKHLDALDPEPAALASCGQVHRGTLPDGRDVAVKVLHPGVEGAVRSGLDLLSTFVRFAGLRVPGVDVGAWLAEGRERLLDELDLEHEAGALRAFSRAYRGHPHVLVPSPEMALCTPNVLVSDWIDGTPFDVVCGLEPDARDAYGETLARCFLSAPLHVGTIHADPHPDNHRLTEDGRVAVLDLGATGHADPTRLADHLDVTLPRLRTLVPWLDAPEAVRLTPERVEPLVEDRERIEAALRALDPAPADLQLGRMLGTLGLVLLRLEAAAPWGALLAEVAGDAEPVTPLGRADAEFWAQRGHSRRDRVSASRRPG